MHAYLLNEGTWDASGSYLDESGHDAACWGRRTIDHGDTWTVDSFLTVQGPETQTFRSYQHVTPLRGDAVSTEYSAESSDLGRLAGRFTFVGDTIIGVGRGAEADLMIVEALRRVDIDRYEARGKLLSDGKLLSAWALDLTRPEASPQP